MYKGFNTVELARPKRSQFDLSHEKKLTARMGNLFPILAMEAVPSDMFRGSSEALLRLAPLLSPIYDRINLYVHYFFIPNRLLWEEWERMITGGRLGVGIDPVDAPIPPQVEIADFMVGQNDPGSLSDYMGLPYFALLDGDPGDWEGKFIDMMPFAAYQCVWFNYYRDRNFVSDDFFQTSPDGNFVPLASGTMTAGDAAQYFQLRQRCYHHDYFTSALPFVQRGEEVLMPVQLGGLAPLYATPVNAPGINSRVSGNQDGGAVQYPVNDGGAGTGLPAGTLYVQGEDFDGTTTSINDFRSAYALQVWLERNAIGGSRYNESTQAHFGVKPQDSRLQRPEYIGGGKIPVQISEVVSTAWSSWTDGVDTFQVPQANMAGHGVTYGNTNRFNYYVPEHGFILGIASIMPVASYMQGLPRMFRRRTFLDYPWPTFSKLGEQPVYDYEIYANPASLTEDVDGEYPEFGFQSRYADWKYIFSSNHGDFKTSLRFWTLVRQFAGPPVLGEAFNTVSNTADGEIFASNDIGYAPYWLYVHNKVSVIRPLPYFGTPNTLNFG